VFFKTRLRTFLALIADRFIFYVFPTEWQQQEIKVTVKKQSASCVLCIPGGSKNSMQVPTRGLVVASLPTREPLTRAGWKKEQLPVAGKVRGQCYDFKNS
jgi:hypothetical protein